MAPRIAIPVPTSFDPEYNDRSWPQYARAVERAGGIPVPIPLDDAPAATAKLIDSCTGILLPGSGADVNPQKYGQALHPAAAPPDPARENVDELLLQDAHNMAKPLLAICFGTQILNVWRSGSIVQDLPSALPDSPANHKAGRDVLDAHPIDIAAHSLLATLLQASANPVESNTYQDVVPSTGALSVPQGEVEKPASPASHESPSLTTLVNSSHHQAIAAPGDGLRIVARSTQDGVIEAVEGAHGDQSASDRDRFFLLGVQWHPERTYDHSPLSRAIFARLIAEAKAWTPRAVTTSVAQTT